MKLTPAEEELVLANRHRLALETKDWSKEPVLTFRDAQTMSMLFLTRMIADRITWVWDPPRELWVNTKHPDNASVLKDG